MFPGTSRQTEASFISWRQLVKFGRLKAGRKGVAGPHSLWGSGLQVYALISLLLYPQIQLELLVSKLFLGVNVTFSSDSSVYLRHCRCL